MGSWLDSALEVADAVAVDKETMLSVEDLVSNDVEVVPELVEVLES